MNRAGASDIERKVRPRSAEGTVRAKCVGALRLRSG